MGAPGFDNAPITEVSLLPDGQAHRVVMIYPFYENPLFLWRQLEHWASWDWDVRGAVNAIIVDDGSPTSPAHPVLQRWIQEHAILPLAIKLYRIEVDVRWNWLAARNIGAHHAPAGQWLMLTDMDHVIPEETAQLLVTGDFNPFWIWNFLRREHTGIQIHAHPNSMFMTREMFWNVGGYDEALSGHYGTDGDWRRRCAAKTQVHRIPAYLERHEYQADSSTTHYLRKQPEDGGKKAIIRRRGPGWRPRTLSFPYHEIPV